MIQTPALTPASTSIKTAAPTSIKIGMELLRQNQEDDNFKKAAFVFFKMAADWKKDPEASWRVAACFQRGIGIEKDLQKALEYSKIAFDANLPDGIFWYTRCLNDQDDKSFRYLKLAAEQNHLAAQYYVGLLTYHKLETEQNKSEQNKSEGQKILQEFFENQKDAYWTCVYAMYCGKGFLSFQIDKEKAAKLTNICTSLPLCDCSVFKPPVFP